ncbi:hypothetical protein KN63_08370 [Smithella sp. F21]|nr:hypothetical protein KN63_08370 [Smithella sp. F21]
MIMKKEYDFSKGVRGKFYKPDIQLNIPVYLEPKLKEYFPDSNSVNEALRCLLPLMDKRKSKERLKHN